MAWLMRAASPLQYSDYWLLVTHYTNPDGSFRLAGLFEFEFQNHPVVVPMLLYWLDLYLFAGSNVALGVVVLILGVGVLAVIGLILRRSELQAIDRMVLFVLASSLIFTPNGAWNYGIAVSGTAWLGAGLIGVVAVYWRSRDRTVLAFAAAVLAALTYATGLMVWPALAAVGACRRPPREWWRELPYVAGFVATYLWYEQVQTTGLGADIPWPSVVDGVRLMAQLLVFPLGMEGSSAEVAGALVLIVTVALVVWGIAFSRSDSTAMWVGIAVFGLGATASLAFGRYTLITAFGNSNRYTSVPTVALIGLAGLLMSAIHEHGERGGEPQRGAQRERGRDCPHRPGGRGRGGDGHGGRTSRTCGTRCQSRSSARSRCTSTSPTAPATSRGTRRRSPTCWWPSATSPSWTAGTSTAACSATSWTRPRSSTQRAATSCRPTPPPPG